MSGNNGQQPQQGFPTGNFRFQFPNGGLHMNFMVMQMDNNGAIPSNVGFPPAFPPQLVNHIFNTMGNGFPNLSNLFGGESNMGGYQTPYGNFRTYQDLLDFLGRQHQPRGAPPAAKDFVERLPVIVISQQDVNENAECAVCKDNFSVDDEAMKLPCQHLYHHDCIKPWLSQHCTCPVCRYELPVDDPEYEKKRQERMAQRPVFEEEQQIKKAADADSMVMSDAEIEALANEFMEQEVKCEMENLHKHSCSLTRPITCESLECGHSFHTECLEKSLRVARYLTPNQPFSAVGQFLCPSCKTETQILKSDISIPEIEVD